MSISASANRGSRFGFSLRQFLASLARIISPRVSTKRNQKTGKRAPMEIKRTQYIHRKERYVEVMAPPTNGPKAIPITDVVPNNDNGKLRCCGPLQISDIVPPTMLIATDEAPPPKNRHMTIVWKFCATPHGMRKIRKTIYAPKYPGIRPEVSVRGTKSNGTKAAPIFQDVVAKYR